MSNKIYYLKGNTYVDGDGKPALIKKGNQLIVTDDFKGGGGEPYVPPAYSTEEHLTGRKWIDGRDIYEKTIVFSEPVNITTSYTDIETDTDVDVPISARAVDPTYKACTPLKMGIENATLKVIAFGAEFTAETITVEFVKATPAEPAEQTNTRTTRKTTKKKG